MAAMKLAVVITHGMGTDTMPGFADGLIAELTHRIASAGKSAEAVAFAPVYWADITQSAQQRYLEAARQAAELNFMSVRHFVVGALGDAAAYQRVDDPVDSVQGEIHARVRDAIHDLYVTQLNEAAVPLVVMAHSLGGHILSNYIWDLQHDNVPRKGLSGFERFWTHAGMVTFGCNIPLFTFAHRKVVPIDFPGPRLDKATAKLARWYNYFDSDDVLGYPLKPLSVAYSRVVDADIEVNVGGLLSSWNPISHTKYWTDDSFTKPVAEFLTVFL
jgi:hypothetical protein